MQSINFNPALISAVIISVKQSYYNLVKSSRSMACEVESEVESFHYYYRFCDQRI